MAQHPSTPRHKRLSRPSRLDAAKHWIAHDPGTNVLRGYRKHFGVDLECALKELALLGITFDAQHNSQWRQSLHAQHEHRRRRRQAQALTDVNAYWEDWPLWFQEMALHATAEDERPLPDANDGARTESETRWWNPHASQ